MQKSTPISHLPSMQMQQPQFNERPQPSQQPELPAEDPVTIQDALDALNVGQPQQAQQVQHQRHQVEESFMYDPDLESMNMPEQPLELLQPQEVDMKTKLINDILSWNTDLKISLFAAGIFVILYSVPIENYIYKYIALDKIPNSNLLIKTVLMFILVLIVSKLIS